MQRTILSTAEVARLFNVTETTVKRWADEGVLKCEKTPGGHRRFDVRNVVEFAGQQHLAPNGALALPESDVLSLPIQLGVLTRDFSRLVDAFVQKALSPDKTDLYRFFSYLYQHRIELWEIYDGVLTPGMVEIGKKWVQGEIGINHEHRATHEVLDALTRLQSEIVIKPSNRMTVVCACPEEELHQIGLRCCGYLFESEGWSVHYLGGRIPLEPIADALRQVVPHVLCISVSSAMEAETLKSSLRYLHRAGSDLGVKLIIGGSGAQRAFVDEHLCDAVATSMKELLDIMSGLSMGQIHPTGTGN